MDFLRTLRVSGLMLVAASQLLPTATMAQTGAPATAVGQDYVLGAGDEIRMTVYGQPDLSVRTRIADDGSVTLPLIGNVLAKGRTPTQFSKDAAALYRRGGYLSDPAIFVEITSFVSRSATVLGNVADAGNYPLDHSYSLAAMIARAGGVRSDGANVVILTPADGSGAVRIPLTDMSGSAARTVQPGDTLFVPPAEMVYIYGQVNQPGAVPYQPGLTYRQALARAGGPTLAGSTRKIEVRRAGESLKGVDIDDIVNPEDVLVIKEKLF